jgi:hypothetical protein
MGHVLILGQTKEFWWRSTFSFISAPVGLKLFLEKHLLEHPTSTPVREGF